jgi:sensor histidine kinase YesM
MKNVNTKCFNSVFENCTIGYSIDFSKADFSSITSYKLTFEPEVNDLSSDIIIYESSILPAWMFFVALFVSISFICLMFSIVYYFFYLNIVQNG